MGRTLRRSPSPAPARLHSGSPAEPDRPSPQGGHRVTSGLVDGEDLFEEHAKLRDHGGDAVWAEGPVWIPELRAVRFSDIPNNRILQWTEADDRISVYSNDAEFTNGRTLGLRGEVIQCSHGRRRVEVDRDGDVTPLVETWRERR